MKNKIEKTLNKILSIVVFLLLPVTMKAQLTFSLDSVDVIGMSQYREYWKPDRPYLNDDIDLCLEYGPFLLIYGKLHNSSDKIRVVHANGLDESVWFALEVNIKFTGDNLQYSGTRNIYKSPIGLHWGTVSFKGKKYEISYIAPGETLLWFFSLQPFRNEMINPYVNGLLDTAGRQALVKQGLEFENRLRNISNVSVDIGRMTLTYPPLSL